MITDQQANQIVELLTRVEQRLARIEEHASGAKDAVATLSAGMDQRMNNVQRTLDEINDGVGDLITLQDPGVTA